MSIVELHEVKCHLHYADDSNDVSLKSFIVAADAIIKNYITDNFGSEYWTVPGLSESQYSERLPRWQN